MLCLCFEENWLLFGNCILTLYNSKIWYFDVRIGFHVSKDKQIFTVKKCNILDICNQIYQEKCCFCAISL